MAAVAVVPTRAAGGQALIALSKWAARHAERNTLSSRKAKTPAALIEKTHTRQVAAREKVFERHLPFSWARFVIGLVSLMLVFSDVLRSGVGISNVSAIYPPLQPDEVVSFGNSWNYTVFALTKDEAREGSKTARVWSYKFDSTSIVWRAFASYLNLATFPSCLLYRSACSGSTFSGQAAFTMIDTLVDAVANSSIEPRRGPVLNATSIAGPVGLTIRTESEYIDRLHQFLLPKLFININWRTNQALYYSPELLANTTARSICFPAIGSRVRSPRFCHELWTNFKYSCPSSKPECQAVGLLYVHTLQRVRETEARYPNASVDLTFLESQEDLQVCRGGLGSLGFRRSDVSTIIRARQCDDSGLSCETLYVDDYRYETGLLTTDVVQWYRVVAALRVIGQSYFLLRGIGLMLSCYFVYGTGFGQKSVSWWTRVRKARHLFMKVPTQCVVFGSPFPIACYVVAHLLDAPFTYDVLESRFFSQDGVLSIHVRLFISYAVVQMRNVWIYALLWHVAVVATTSRWLVRSHYVNNGVIGVPEFLLSAFSSITLSAQYRSTSFRSSKILKMMVLASDLGHAWVPIKYQYGFGHRGSGSLLLGGVIIDLKYFACLVIIVFGLWAARILVLEGWTCIRGETTQRFSNWFILAPTPVPYSAGVLWPCVSMCVHWTSDFFCIRENLQPQRLAKQRKPRRSSLQELTKRNSLVIPYSASFPSKIPKTEELRDRLRRRRYSTPSALMGLNTFRFIQHQMKCLHGRGDDVEANVAFMNAVVMSDPLVYLRTKLGRDRSTELAYYQSLLRPHQVVLLPVVVVGEHNEYTSGLKLLRRVNASELSWPELVQCG